MMATGTIAGIAIGGATLLFVLITLIWGTGLWRHREKVRIRVIDLNYKVDASGMHFKFYPNVELRRSGGKDIRCIRALHVIPLDTQTYSELNNYFQLPEDRQIAVFSRTELPRDKIVTFKGGNISFPSHVAPVNNEALNEVLIKVEPIARGFGEKAHKIAIRWEDTDKVIWKTVPYDKFKMWV